MRNSVYEHTRAAFQEDLKRLAEERETLATKLAAIDQRIQAVSAADSALSAIQEDETSPDPPSCVIETAKFEITAGIRDFLRSAPGAVAAPAIRDALAAKGWQAGNYANPLAVVHQVLTRLVRNGEISRDGEGLYIDRAKAAELDRQERAGYAAKRAKQKDNLAARAEKRHMLAGPSCEIVRMYPGGISAKAIAWKLEANGIDLSCYDRPSSAIAQALKDSPFVRRVEEDRADGPLQGYYYPVAETITVPPGGTGTITLKLRART